MLNYQMKFNFWKKIFTNKILSNKNNLNRNNLYIFPNYRGFQIAALIFFCFAVAIFYQNNFALLLSIILFFIYFISIILTYQNLLDLNFQIINKLIPANQKIQIDLVIKAKKNKERLNISLDYLENVFNIDIFDIKKISLNTIFKKRGVTNSPNLKIKSTFPFGIIKSFGEVAFNEKIVVYPEPKRPPDNIFDKIFDVNQDEGFDYEFDKIEETKDIKNLSKISWKHFSIKQKYFLKIFKFSKNNKKVIIDIDQLDSTNFEKSLSYASYLIEYFYKKKNPFCLKHKNYQSRIACSFSHKNEQLTYLANV